MSRRGRDTASTAASLLVAVLMVTSAMGSGVALADVVGGDEPLQTQDSSSVEVDSALESGNGTVEVVVRLDELSTSDLGVSRTPAVDQLRSHAETTQEPVNRFASMTQGVSVERQFWITNAVVVTVDTERVPVERLAEIPGVTKLHRNFEVELIEGPSESSVAASSGTTDALTTSDTTYGLDQINASETWNEVGVRGDGVRVAVLDTGADANHSDIEIAKNGWAEFDSDGSQIDSAPNDGQGHGTHVSGTVAGGAASGTHIGVAPNASLMHGKVLDDNGFGTISSVTAGMQWAVENDADVISMSLGWDTNEYREEFIDPVRNAEAAGVVVVASIGNDGPGTSSTPGNDYDTLAVGASDQNGDIAYFSSGDTINTSEDWGSDAPADWPDEFVVPDVAGPGVDVYSSVPDGGYDRYSGTSMAAPHVAGTVALMLSANESLTPGDAKATLRETAWKPDGASIEKDTRYGDGIIDAYAATAQVESNSYVAGRVTNASGDSLSSATVESEYGVATTTNATGWYNLSVPAGTLTVSADAFGYGENATTVTAVENGTTLQNFTLGEKSPEVAMVDGPAQYAESGTGSVRTTFRVANLENVTVTTGENTSVNESTLTLKIDGNETGFNNTETYTSQVDDDQFNVTVEAGSGTLGDLELRYEFGGADGTERYSTASTRIHPDPLTVPDDKQFDSPQNAIEFAAPGTTVALNRSYEVQLTNVSGDYAYGVEIRKPLTLTAADGASPTLTMNASSVNDSLGRHGVRVESGDVTVSGLELDSQGIEYAVTVDEYSPATDESIDPTDTPVAPDEYREMDDADADELNDSALDRWNVTVDELRTASSDSGPVTVSGNVVDNATFGTRVAPSSGANVTDNEFTNVTAGVYAQLYDTTNVSGNAIDASSIGVYTVMSLEYLYPSSYDTSTNVEGNTVVGNATVNSSVGVGVAYAATADIRGNNVTDADGGVVAGLIKNGTVASNRVDNATDGVYLITDGSEISNNEVTDSERGISLLISYDNTLSDNVLRNNTDGVYAEYSSNNTITNTTVSNSTNWAYNATVYTANDVDRLHTDSATVSFTGEGVAVGADTASSPTNPPRQEHLGHQVRVTNQSADAWANVTVHYEDDDAKNTSGDELRLWATDDASTEWDRLPGDSNATTQQVDGSVSEFADSANGTLVAAFGPLPVNGTLYENDSSPSAHDQLVLTDESGDVVDTAVTDANGNFSAYPKGGETLDVAFYQNASDPNGPAFPRDENPDIYALERVTESGAVDIGSETLPDATLLNVTVTNESGTPVQNATVAVQHNDSDSDAIARAVPLTNENGTPEFTDSDSPGVELVGDVLVLVGPPEDSAQYLLQEERLDPKLGGPNLHVVELQENTAPTADAGGNRTATAGNDVSLNATNTSDPDPHDVGYAWEQVGGPNVTLSNASAAQPTFTAPDVDGATNLTFQLRVEDRPGLTDADRVTVTVKPPATGGGGGGGGGVGPPSILTSVTPTDDGVVIEISNGRPGPTARTMLDGVGTADVTITQLDVRFARENPTSSFELATGDEPSDGVPAFDGEAAVGYVTVQKDGVTNEGIEEITFHFTLADGALPEDASPGDVSLYRYHDGEWTELDTERRGSGYAASAPGASTFAVGVDSTDESTGGAGATATSTPTPTPTEGESPGFGVVAAVLALLAAALLARRAA